MTSPERTASANNGIARPLAEIAEQINRHHDQFAQHGQKALEHVAYALDHARTAGELLLEAKRNIQHGGWLDWLSENCHVGDRQARKYMAVASADPNIITEAIAEGLTIDRAVARIASAKKRPKSEPSTPVKKPNRNCNSDLHPTALLTTGQAITAEATQSRLKAILDALPPMPNPNLSQSEVDAFADRMARMRKEDPDEFRRQGDAKIGNYLRMVLAFEDLLPLLPANDPRTEAVTDSMQQAIRLAKEMSAMNWDSAAFRSRFAMLIVAFEHGRNATYATTK
ncbi:MAG TPA: hypothetical protein DDZ51_10470 [Planctomycetaceae bacterium]|nr:hypothetical protein [Planctomycetaceae bacterium]